MQRNYVDWEKWADADYIKSEVKYEPNKILLLSVDGIDYSKSRCRKFDSPLTEDDREYILKKCKICPHDKNCYNNRSANNTHYCPIYNVKIYRPRIERKAKRELAESQVLATISDNPDIHMRKIQRITELHFNFVYRICESFVAQGIIEFKYVKNRKCFRVKN